jgi:cyclophilin family peptidyl-prolyl cis-trans isomerase
MPRRTLALAALVTLLAGGAPPRRAGAAPAPEPAVAVTDIPVGIPVTLDGRPLPGEWEDAATLPIAGGIGVRVKQHRGMLLLAAALPGPWPAMSVLALYARAGTGEGTFQDEGAVIVDLEPREHNRPHALVRVRTKDGWRRTDGRVALRTAGIDEAATLEAAVPLALFGLASREPPPLRWVLTWITPGRTPSHRTYPAGLDLSASPGGIPPGLASTKGWALTEGFPDAAGPGPWRATEWEALIAADVELTKRGEAAHAKVLELTGGGEGGAPAERPKRDAPIVSTVLDGLRWIAEREPLTRADVRASALALLQVNRAPEAVASMETLLATAPGGPIAEDYRVAAMVALDAERFEDAARWYEAVAARVPEAIRPHYTSSAARAREWGEAWTRERAAREADALRDDLPIAVLSTSKGDVVLRLLEDDCPQSVAQFIHLAEAAKAEDGTPFYERTLFHRVVAAGVAQGGDPRSRTEGCEGAGAGGSSWFIALEKNPRHAFFRGSVGFAMGPDKKVRSQFFIMTAPKPRLAEGGYPCFATVIGGMDVVDRLEACDVLKAVRILEKRDHPYEPKKSY